MRLKNQPIKIPPWIRWQCHHCHPYITSTFPFLLISTSQQFPPKMHSKYAHSTDWCSFGMQSGSKQRANLNSNRSHKSFGNVCILKYENVHTQIMGEVHKINFWVKQKKIQRQCLIFHWRYVCSRHQYTCMKLWSTYRCGCCKRCAICLAFEDNWKFMEMCRSSMISSEYLISGKDDGPFSH